MRGLPNKRVPTGWAITDSPDRVLTGWTSPDSPNRVPTGWETPESLKGDELIDGSGDRLKTSDLEVEINDMDPGHGPEVDSDRRYGLDQSGK